MKRCQSRASPLCKNDDRASCNARDNQTESELDGDQDGYCYNCKLITRYSFVPGVFCTLCIQLMSFSTSANAAENARFDSPLAKCRSCGSALSPWSDKARSVLSPVA